jgi:hypothetical protein
MEIFVEFQDPFCSLELAFLALDGTGQKVAQPFAAR